MTTTVLLALPTGPSDDTDGDIRGLAQHLLRRGCRVVVSGRDIATLLDAVRGHGADRTAVVVGDLSDRNRRQSLIDSATTCFGAIDHIIEFDDTVPDAVETALPLAA